MEWLKTVHFYRKVPSDLTEATLAGGSLSLISALVMAYLFFSNFSAFLQVGLKTRQPHRTPRRTAPDIDDSCRAPGPAAAVQHTLWLAMLGLRLAKPGS
jgi:hypothetical protein